MIQGERCLFICIAALTCIQFKDLGFFGISLLLLINIALYCLIFIELVQKVEALLQLDVPRKVTKL